MDLTELQVNLRNIEEDIGRLQTEIEKMKPKTNSAQKENFTRIDKIAKVHALQNKFLLHENDAVKKAYLTCLSYIMLADEVDIYDKLIYITRIGYGIKADLSSEDIYKAGRDMDKDYLEDSCMDLSSLKYCFIADALIVANIKGQAAASVLTLIADLAQFMQCTKADFNVITAVVKAVLTNKFDILKEIDAPLPDNRDWTKQLSVYVPKWWIVKQRVECGKYIIADDNDRLSAKHSDEIKYIKKNNSIIRSDELLIDYKRVKYLFGLAPIDEKEPNIIYSPCSGIVFITNHKIFLEFGYLSAKEYYLYVCSYFDDYDDFCQWFADNHKEKE